MDLEQAAGAAGALERHLAGQLAAALARPGEAEMAAALAAAAEVYRDIAPEDALEKLLAVQMIAGHEAALDGFARARVAADEREKRAELRLAARLSALFARQAATLGRRRAEARRAREAAEKQAARARQEARKVAQAEAKAQAAARPRGGGVLVVPHEPARPGEPERPWPDPEAVAAALAKKRAQAEGGPPAQAAPGPPGGVPKGPGYLIVPGTAEPEDWNRRAREHHRRLKEQMLRADRGAGGGG